ncbi:MULTISPECIES: hypothetical protein [Microbacterium]|uniref:hypothetical protein n=1 Tax=Microbacterium TaxID=33882 RepID=UPI00344D8B27
MTTPYPLSVGANSASAASSSDSFEVWSVLVAAFAAFFAAASLVTQLRETYWSRPVIVLDTSLRSSSRGWEAQILVTNVGERAVTITRSGWWFSYGTHYEDVIEANKTVKLPYRLEPHDAIAFRDLIEVDEADWTRANGGLYKPAESYDGISEGAWRNDELPELNQYADPFVEVVRRPRGFVIRSAGVAVRRVGRALMWRSAKTMLKASWWRFMRQNTPKGHARIWGQPQIVREPVDGM